MASERKDAPELPDFTVLKRLSRDQLIYILEQVFGEIRNEHFPNVFGFLSQKACKLQTQYDVNIGACESIMKKKTKQDFQELMKTEHCLITKDYRSLKTQYLQSYGPEHLLTFSNLKQTGLLTEQVPGETLTAVENKMSKLVTDKAVGKLTDAFSSLAKKRNFRGISKKLGLIPRVDGEYDLKTPKDMAYIFSGAYIPLSCKLMEQVLQRNGWTGLEEVTRLLNGNEFVAEQLSDRNSSSNSQRTIVVFFLGGCTFSEISALHFLGKETGTFP